MQKVRRALWLAVVVAAAASSVLWLTARTTSNAEVQLARMNQSFAADFELTDHTGATQVDENFRGRWMLVFFGFTNCPDICPMGLSSIAQVMNDLGPDSAVVQPLFITVDPERDTPNVLAEYVPLFGADILGLSGSPEQIERTAETFKVYYQKIEEASAPDGYTMGHTSSFMLFDPQGEFSRIYEFDRDPADIVADLRERISQ